MTASIVDPVEFGADIAVGEDLTAVWGLASGVLNLAYALLRRVTTAAGSFDDIEDEPVETIDLKGFLNSKVSKVTVANLKSRLSAVCRDDPRVDTCSPEVTFTLATKTLKIDLQCTTDAGPFDLVLSANAVNVEILSINGVPAPTPIPPTTQVIAIVGLDGAAGPQGPAGTSGTASVTLDFGIEGDIAARVTSSGAEEVLYQRLVRFGDLPGSLTVAIIGEILSAAGTATFRVRIGGSSQTVDGTLVLTYSTASGTFVAGTASGAFTNPSGNLYVKLTGQSSGGAVDAMARPPVVTIR